MIYCTDQTVTTLMGVCLILVLALFLSYHHLKVREGEWRRRLDLYRLRGRAEPSEPMAWAPVMQDEDFETLTDGLLYEGETGQIQAYREPRQARAASVHSTIIPLYAHPVPEDQRRADPSGEVWEEDMDDVPGDPRISLRGDPAGLEQDYS